MPVKIDAMKNMRRTVTVEYDGDKCAVTYRVGVYTPAFVDSLAREQSISKFLSTQICALVEHWEVLDADGKEISPTPELVGSLPQQFLNAVLDAIRADVRMPRAQKNS